MHYIKHLVFVVLVIAVSGCYHAKVTTGLEPSNRTIEEPFASSWVYGLVPPKMVETEDVCTNGVAMVETQLSFVNGLVGSITFGIYTPMNIKVTCAASSASLQIDEPKGHYTVLSRSDNLIEDLQRASDYAVASEHPVYLRAK